MSLADIQNQHIRGALLGLLKDGVRANDSVLDDALTQVKGITASRDQVRSALRWLAEQGLVEIEDLGGYLVARITQRGVDFEDGAIHLDGIKRKLG